MNMNKKVFVIGIDSATFDIINPLIKKGALPNLELLIKEGVSGKLKSTIPPVTPPAWTSFMTGKNPGKHGVFDFYAPPNLGYQRPILNSKFNKAKTIWKILSENGKKVGIINMPMTYPPEEVNGFIIPGMQYGLDTNSGFSYPKELMHELNKAIGGYKVLYGDMVSLYADIFDNLLKEWREIVKLREKAILYLMERYEWDFFMAVFYSIDVMQHHFWKFYDKSHPLYKHSEYSEIIPEFYKCVDSSVGEILRRLDEDTVVMVVSDHGAGPEHKAFYINKWLAKEGFLTFKPKYIPLWKFRLPHIIYKILRRAGVKAIEWTVPISYLPLLWRKIDPREGLRVHELINWNKTKAYSGNHTEQGIYINLKGREPYGIVESGKEYEEIRNSIIEKLRKVEDHKTGERVVSKIYKKEEIYKGPYTYLAPDIFVDMKEGQYLIQKEVYNWGLFNYADKSSGTHRMDGIFIMKGANVKRGEGVDNLNITDIAPTILHVLGVPVPDDMDGKVLTQLFKESFQEANPVRYTKIISEYMTDDRGIYSDEEDEKMRKMLRDLGYMG